MAESIRRIPDGWKKTDTPKIREQVQRVLGMLQRGLRLQAVLAGHVSKKTETGCHLGDI